MSKALAVLKSSPISSDTTILWLSHRVRILCVLVFFIASLLPSYVPKAALAPPETSVATNQFLLVEDGFLMKTSSLTGQGSRRAYAEGVVHTVKEGESLEKIADRYGVSVQTIQWANTLEAGKPIRPGQELIILPVEGVLHRVKRGQTLLGIAEMYDIEASAIAAQNKLERGLIFAGQEIIIPGGKPIVEKPTVTVAQRPKAPPPSARDLRPDQPKGPPPPVEFAPELSEGILQQPCDEHCNITQYYHPGHYALDMQTKGGGPIYAAEAGTVIRADYGWNGGYGNVIEIDHGNGLVTLYGHNKELYVSVGDAVERGQRIAAMGNTGLVYGKTGIHVHFEVRVKGIKKNPLLYVQ